MNREASFAVTDIPNSSTKYPTALRTRGYEQSFPNLQVIGDIRILERPLLGFICSQRCPGDVIVQVYELARALRDANVPVIGGFHSPMERECLDLLLRGTQPVVICPARSIGKMRMPGQWRSAIDGGRVLLLSPFSGRQRRPTGESSTRRNQLVGGVASEVMVPYAEPGGKTLILCKELVGQGRLLWTFDLPTTSDAVHAGAQPTNARDLVARWRTSEALLLAGARRNENAEK